MAVSVDPHAVRAVLDLSLDETALPDVVIFLAPFAEAALAEILRRDPDASTRTGAAAQRLNTAADYLTAARLAPALPVLVRERVGELESQFQATDWTARAVALRAQADAELTAVLDTAADASFARPIFFTLATGRRGA